MIFKPIIILSINILFMFYSSGAYASPSDGNIAYGNVDIVQNGGHTGIIQHSDKAIINWGSFNIGAGEYVDFRQPGSNSAVLNRVTGGNPSEIYGRLTGNGNVFLINPDGILIGNGASIETGSFLGGTAGIADKDFLNGRYFFEGASGDVVNKGSIKVKEGGFAAVIGKKTSNDGVISAKLGKVVMASGESFRLDFDGSGLIGIEVDKGIPGAYVSNSGRIEGASVIMTAESASELLIGAVNNSGVIRASGISDKGGSVVLTGGGVTNGGTIDASGSDGGSVLLDGSEYAAAEAGSVVSANGETSGGDIRFLSEGYALFKKGAKAEARSVFGKGGFIEVSGKSVMTEGIADARSSCGEAGSFLIDPLDVIIMKDAPTGPDDGGFTADGVSYIDMDYINRQLSLVSAFTISTSDTEGTGSGDITVAGGTGSVISGSSLTLRSAGDIIIANEEINLSGSLGLEAGGSVVSSAKLSASEVNAASAGSIINISNIDAVGAVRAEAASGSVSLGGGGDVNVASAVGNQVFISAAGKVTGEGIKSSIANISSGGDAVVKMSSERITVVSETGSVNIENSYAGDAFLDSAKTNGGDINYVQYGSGLAVGADTDARGGFIGITNESGTIRADFDFISDPAKNILFRGKEIYLVKSGGGTAEIGAALSDRTDSSLLDIRSAGDIKILNDIDKPGTSLYLASADGAVLSEGGRITVSSLDIKASGDINVVTAIDRGNLVSSGGNLSVSEKDGAEFELLSAAEGGVSAYAESAGDFKIYSLSSKEPVNIKTADNVNVYISGGRDNLAFNFENGAENNISVENGMGITVSSINAPGVKELSLISASGGLVLPGNSLSVADKITLKGGNINNGEKFSLISENIILDLKEGGSFDIDAEKADISGGRFILSLKSDISFEDMDNDRTAVNTEYFDAVSSDAVSVANRAESDFFKVNAAGFILSSFDSSVNAGVIDIRVSEGISGTGRLTGTDVYLEGESIGLDSSILVEAEKAVFRTAGSDGEKTISIAAPNWFAAIKSYMFVTGGTAYLNGIPVNKGLYALIKESELYDFFPYESNNIGTGHTRIGEESGKQNGAELITSEIRQTQGFTTLSRVNGKTELK